MTKSYSVGDTFTHVRECDRYRPIYYAAASGDFNPSTSTPMPGSAAGLGGNILQGLCTMGWAVEGFVNYLGDPGKVSKVKVRFSRPVMVEDTITIIGKVTSIEGGDADRRADAKNQKAKTC